MELATLKTATITIGAKQTRKAIERGDAVYVFIGNDVDATLREPLRALCIAHGVPVDETHTMTDLGKAANIKVKAAAVGVLG